MEKDKKAFFYAPDGWHIVIYSSVRQSVRPSVSQSVRQFLFCPENNLKTMQGINMKLHR